MLANLYLGDQFIGQADTDSIKFNSSEGHKEDASNDGIVIPIRIKQNNMVHLDIIPELDDGEILHNHLAFCPACQTVNVSMNLYGEDIYQLAERMQEKTEIKCEHCETTYKLFIVPEGEGIDSDKWVWIRIEPKA